MDSQSRHQNPKKSKHRQPLPHTNTVTLATDFSGMHLLNKYDEDKDDGFSQYDELSGMQTMNKPATVDLKIQKASVIQKAKQSV